MYLIRAARSLCPKFAAAVLNKLGFSRNSNRTIAAAATAVATTTARFLLTLSLPDLHLYSSYSSTRSSFTSHLRLLPLALPTGTVATTTAHQQPNKRPAIALPRFTTKSYLPRSLLYHSAHTARMSSSDDDMPLARTNGHRK